MSKRHHNVYIDGAVCFWTSSIIDWLPVFRSKTACEAVVAILDDCRSRCGVKLVAYVLMPDHVHLAIWAEEAEDVKRFLRQFLRLSSAEIVTLADTAAQRGSATAAKWLQLFRSRARGRARVRVWKAEGRGFPVTEMEALREKLDYIHQNPVRRGLAEYAQEWEFSSASWYESGSGVIQMDSLDW
jgi:putative transposase